MSSCVCNSLYTLPSGMFRSEVLKQACLPEKWESPKKGGRPKPLHPELTATLEAPLNSEDVEDADRAAMDDAYSGAPAAGHHPRPPHPTVRARLQSSLPDWEAAVLGQW